ncbi:MAG: polyisoprenyl-teichoic acid--peptidoglycan teichoic acid transferase [Solirubrobacteraceae bacterium]|jgi:LCP family protein required for cell wall assembly|nr:polyisoprenyl-teichoic acid--peptidoglycan teichoic acid transferase [Solirubrobacteraceae bacterium]
MPTEPFQKKAGPTRRHYVIGAALIVLLIAGGAIAVVLLEVHHINRFFPKSTLPKAALKNLTPPRPGAAETILVIGSDKRARSTVAADRASPPRSDTLMLIRMDPDQHQTSILSIPRDLKTTLVSATGATVTEKINAAYSLGGSALVAQTIKQTMPGLDINHIIDVDYAGFRKVIDAIGCVYVYVDRRYLNQNTGTIATNYASIDIQAGYQKLCGGNALDYVRYRHGDTDVVRVARQQDFIRQAKQQVGVKSIFDNQDALLGGLREAVQTDIHGDDVLHMIDLALFSLGRPVRQVQFQQTLGASYVTATPEQISATENDFLYNDQPATVKLHSVHTHTPTGRAALGLSATPPSDVALETQASVGLPFPLAAPRLRVNGANATDLVRSYTLPDEHNAPHRAYVISIARGLVGQYYGIEGSDWMSPPILAGTHQTQTIAGRTYSLYVDGSHLRIVAWQTARAVYWVNNTLLDSLSNQQMLAIAQSTQPIA